LLFWSLIAPSGLSFTKREFANLYAGAIFAARGDYAALYDREPSSTLGLQLIGTTEVQFVRPPFYALMLLPLAWLDYDTALAVFVTINLAALGFIWLWTWRTAGAPGLLVAVIFPAPMVAVFMCGQDSMLLVAVLLATFLLAERRRDGLAGAVLSLALCKFHLIILLPIALLASRRWRMLAGFALGALGLGAVSLILVGPQGIAAYVHLLMNPELRSLVAPAPAAVSPAAACLVIVIALAVSWVAPFWLSISTAIVGSLLVAPHLFLYDQTMLLLPLPLAFAASTTALTRLAVIVVASPIPYLAGPPWEPLSLAVFFAALTLERLLMNHPMNKTAARPASTLIVQPDVPFGVDVHAVPARVHDAHARPVHPEVAPKGSSVRGPVSYL
jgi:hypothetical protein